MAIRIQRATVSDAMDLVRVTGFAFADDILNKRITTQNTTTSGREEYLNWRVQTITQEIQRPGCHWYKAVDLETRTIVGCGLICEPDCARVDPRRVNDRSDCGEPKLPACLDTAILSSVEQAMTKARIESMGEKKNIWYVASMAIHPAFQRRGIAGSLLSEMIAPAKRDGQDIYLVSSPAGLEMYRRAGFDKLGSFDLLDGCYTYTPMLLKM